MFWTTEHFQSANCTSLQKYLLSWSLCAIVSHIFSWYTQCFEQRNTSNVATHKSVCQALNHCLAHIELVHSLFSTTTPTRQLPAVRSLLKQLFMPVGDGFDEKCKKKTNDYADCSQSYRCVSFMPGLTQARLTFITLPPGLQCIQWSIIIHITTIPIIVS